MRQELEEQPMNIPLIAITTPNDNLGAEFLAVSISQRVTAQHIIYFIEAMKKAENEEMHNALQVFIAELNKCIEKRGKGNGYGFKVGTIVKKGVLYFVDDTEYTKGMSSAVLDFFEKY